MAMIHLEPQTAQMFSRALGALKPPPNLTLSQWADNYRRLSAEASAAQGRWNTDNAPFQREIMDAIGEFPIVKDTTPNMMNPRLYTTSYNKPQGQQFDDTAVLSFIKLQYT